MAGLTARGAAACLAAAFARAIGVQGPASTVAHPVAVVAQLAVGSGPCPVALAALPLAATRAAIAALTGGGLTARFRAAVAAGVTAGGVWHTAPTVASGVGGGFGSAAPGLAGHEPIQRRGRGQRVAELAAISLAAGFRAALPAVAVGVWHAASAIATVPAAVVLR